MTTPNLARNAELSTFSNLAYSETPPDNFNGWKKIDVKVNTANGFFAVAYRNPATNEVVIAFRGTDGLKGDLRADGSFITGSWHPQFSDAAKFTNDVKEAIVSLGIQNPTFLTTGHSLGGAIAQVMGKMFGLDGATFDAPGANGVTQSSGFLQTAALYGQAGANQVAASFMNYVSHGSLISAVDQHIGDTQSIVNLANPSLAPLLIGTIGAMLGSPVLSVLGFGAVADVMSTHLASGIERAMYAAAALDSALKGGTLKMTNMPWTQATGQPWPYDGAAPMVPVFTDAYGKVLAVVNKDGDTWKVSTPDQQTVITLTPGQTANDAPQCTVAQVGKATISCTMSQANNGSVVIKTDSNGDHITDQISTSNTNVNNVEHSTSTDVVNYVTNGSAAGSIANETITTTSADKKTSTVQIDANGDGIFEKVVASIDANLDGKADQITSTRRNTDDSTSTDVIDYDFAGSKTFETRTTASADGKTLNIEKDIDGDGQFDRSEYAWNDAQGNAIGRVVEAQSSATASAFSASNPLQSQLERLYQNTGQDDNYTLEVAVIRKLVGAQAAGEIWAGQNLLCASDAPQNLELGQENAHTALQDFDDEVWIDGLEAADWIAVRANNLNYWDSASIWSSTPATPPSWESTPDLSLFGDKHTMFQVDRLAELLSAMNDFEASHTELFSGFRTPFSFEFNHWDGQYMPYYNDFSPGFSDLPTMDFGFEDFYYAPVVLDLDGDGVELVREDQSHAYFDVKGTGFKSHVGWIGADDGFLTIDINGDGNIDQAKELSFALWTEAANDSDMDGLRTVFDTNHDGKISSADAQFSQLRVWQDANSNGITDGGELKTLTQMGIASVNLTVAPTQWSSGGNKVDGFSTYTRTNGTVGMSADVELGYSGPGWQSSVSSNMVRMTQSGGLTFGLAQGNALNIDLGAGGLNGAFGSAGADTLSSTGTQAVVLQGEAGNDVLTGGAGDDWLSGGDGSDALNGGAGDDTLLIDAQDLQANINGGSGFNIAVITGSARVILDLGLSNLEAVIGGTGNDVLSNSGYGRVILAGGLGNDVLKGGRGNDVLEGGAGDDQLSDLTGGNDTYLFTRGDGKDTLEDQFGVDKLVLQSITSQDCLFSRVGLDLLLLMGQGDQIRVKNYYDNSDSYKIERIEFSNGEVWTSKEIATNLTRNADDDIIQNDNFLGRNTYTTGKGNDTIIDSGGGDDSYVFSRGDGQDTIVDSGVSTNNDRIIFINIASTEALLTHDGLDLLLGLGQADQITIKNYFDLVSNSKIERVEFSNGVVWGVTELELAPVRGTAGDDVLTSTCFLSNDNYIGGKGNDLITDSMGGNDSYIFYRGDGQDTIVESGVSTSNDRIVLVDITSTQTTLTHIGMDLLLSFGQADQITVEGYFDYLGSGKIERVEFSDGVVWTGVQLDAAKTVVIPVASAVTQISNTPSTEIAQTFYNPPPIFIPPLPPITFPSIFLPPQPPISIPSISIAPVLPISIPPIFIAPVLPISIPPIPIAPVLPISAVVLPPVAVLFPTLQPFSFPLIPVPPLPPIPAVVLPPVAVVGVAVATGIGSTAQSSISYVLGATEKNLTLTGSAAIDGTGNEQDNTLTGNQGDNTLTGGKGNDTLVGQAGSDTYQFARGDGQDTIVESDATAGNTDVLKLTNANQNNLWFKHVGNNLQINLMGTTDQITIKDWYAPSTSGTDNQIERIKTADGLTMYSTDVEQFVQAMAAFAPPSATQTSWTNGQTSNGQILLAVAH